MSLLSEYDQTLSEIVKPFYKYFKSSELNFEINNRDEVLEKFKEKYSDGKQDFLDGLTTEYKDWWFNVRPSNTEPLLRLTVEADNKALLEKKTKELTKLIKNV